MTTDSIAVLAACMPNVPRAQRPPSAITRLVVAATLCFALQASVLAQPVPAAGSSAQRDKSFEAMMADPLNQEQTFAFARAAAAAGDLRGAIAALERMLRINPGLPNIELELGVLYLRAGSPELASLHLRQALSAPDVPGPVRDRAQALLARAEIAKGRRLLTGSLVAGLRHDSNANAGPDSRVVRVLGTDGLLDEQATGRSDVSAELAGSLNYVQALDSQAGHEIEASLSSYNRRYDKSRQLDLNSVSFEVGPRLYLSDAATPAFSVRPFVSGSYLLLDGDKYLSHLGAGLNLRRFFGAASFVDATLEASDQKYYDSANRTTNSVRSGRFAELRLNLSHQVAPAMRLFGGVSAAARDSRADYESFKEIGARLGISVAHAAPFGITASVWSTTLSAGVRRARYDAVDPAVDPDVRRRDTRGDLTLSTSLRLASNLTLTGSLSHTDNNSNLPNFEYDNQAVSLGLAWSF